MKIGIDIDDTISNTYEIQFALAQDYTINILKRSGKIQELTNLNTHFYTKYLHGWNQEEEKQFFDWCYQEVLSKVEPKMYAAQIIKQLKEQGNEIYIITARFEWEGMDVKSITEQWLEKYQIPYDKLILNAQEKHKIASEYAIDVFLDDSFKNCQEVSGMGIKTYIMDSRVNRELQDPKVQRVYSWPHFLQQIENHQKEEN